MYANCRGIKGKKDSFKEVVEKINPDVIILNETMYRNNEKTNIQAYKSYTNNREEKSGGGIEILVRKNIENKTIKISEGTPGIEELTVRTESKKRIINIISLYGKTEGRETKENIKKQFSHLEELIKRIESSGEDYILIGDLNAKIGCKEDGIEGNNEEQNEAGKALLNLEQTTQGIILNKTPKCKGKWTRVNTKKDTEKSILDYVMTNESIYDDIIEMKVDEEKLYRLTKYKGKEITETDHNTIIIEMNDTRQQQKIEKKVKWNTKNTNGWKLYKEKTEKNKDLDQTWRSMDVQKEWGKWVEVMNKILAESLGKVRISNRNKQGIDDEVRELMQEKRKVRSETNITENLENKKILIERRKEIETQIKKKIEENEEEKITEMTNKLSDKKNNNKELWKIKRRTQTKQTSAFSVKDKDGNDITNPEDIKKRVSEYYDELYEYNEIKAGYEDYHEEQENFIKQCWNSKADPVQELEGCEILEIIKNLEKEKAVGPDSFSNEMIKDGGRSMKESVIRMMKIIYETEELPNDWNKAYIKNIYKGKGSKKEISNYRGLILNSHLPKLFEKILELKEREALQNMSEYQCGARKGKSIREHHLTIRTIKEIAKRENEEITAVYFDIKKCFDKMVLKEAMKELWLKGIQGKHWRLIYKLNSNNILTPITDLGECEPVKVKEMIKQGSVLGSVVSSLTIDSLTRILDKCENTWEVEGTKIKPLLFQDDIIAINRTKDIQKTVNLIETFQHLKRLEFHEGKTKKSILNGKSDVKIEINEREIKRTSEHTYLGKVVEEGLKEKKEIQERIKMARIQSNECMSIINNKLLSRKRIRVGVNFLQTMIIPTLTFGAETWNKLTEKEKDEINGVQTSYLTKLLDVPVTTPKCALIGSLNLTKIEHIANARKLQYYVDLQNREENRLEVKMQKLQQNKNMSYEREINELREKYNLEICLKGENTKTIKNHIKTKIKKKNDEEIEEEIKEGKKSKMMNDYNREYIDNLHFEDARAIFMMLTRMIDVKSNFKNKYKNLDCETCSVEENTQHLFKCKKYQDLNRKIKGETIQEVLRNNSEIDIAIFLKKVIRSRDKEREKEKPKKKTTNTAPLSIGLSLPDGRE